MTPEQKETITLLLRAKMDADPRADVPRKGFRNVEPTTPRQDLEASLADEAGWQALDAQVAEAGGTVDQLIEELSRGEKTFLEKYNETATEDSAKAIEEALEADAQGFADERGISLSQAQTIIASLEEARNTGVPPEAREQVIDQMVSRFHAQAAAREKLAAEAAHAKAKPAPKKAERFSL